MEPTGDLIMRVSRAVARGTAVPPHVDYDDLAQEASLRIIEHLPKYDRTRPFATWAWPYATGAIVDYIRRVMPGKRSGVMHIGGGVTVPARWPVDIEQPTSDQTDNGNFVTIAESLPDPTCDVEAQTQASVAARRALGVMRDLPQRTQDTVLRVWVLGQAPGKVAEDLGVTNGRVSQLLNDARAVMQPVAA